MFYMLWEGVGYFVLVLLIERVAVSRVGDFISGMLSTINVNVSYCCYMLRTGGGRALDGSGLGAVVVEEEEEEDVDVAEERRRIESGEAARDPETVLCVHGLRKVYPGGAMRPPKVAVAGMHVSVQKGMCFGLLGVNGAGKTSTLAMLTGEVTPSAGDAWVNGHSIVDEMEQVLGLGLGLGPSWTRWSRCASGVGECLQSDA